MRAVVAFKIMASDGQSLHWREVAGVALTPVEDRAYDAMIWSV
jgi:hypothetical protein